LLERIEELSQVLARLNAENTTTREWVINRLQLVWDRIDEVFEKMDQRDAITAEALKNVVEHGEEMSRLLGLDIRGFGEKVEGLFKLPLVVDPRQTTLPFASTTTLQTPSPKKRPADSDASAPKRRKLGGS